MTSRPSILWGDIMTSARQEVLQVGYLHTVAAAAGCSLSSPWPDVLGTDWNVEHTAHVKDPVLAVRLQLKATYQVTPAQVAGKQEFSFALENKHLARLKMAK